MKHELQFARWTAQGAIQRQLQIESDYFWAIRDAKPPEDTTKLKPISWRLAPLTAFMSDIIKHTNKH